MTMLENSVRSLASALASLEAKIEAGLAERDVSSPLTPKITESLRQDAHNAREIVRDASKELSDIIAEAESLLADHDK